MLVGSGEARSRVDRYSYWKTASTIVPKCSKAVDAKKPLANTFRFRMLYPPGFWQLVRHGECDWQSNIPNPFASIRLLFCDRIVGNVSSLTFNATEMSPSILDENGFNRQILPKSWRRPVQCPLYIFSGDRYSSTPALSLLGQVKAAFNNWTILLFGSVTQATASMLDTLWAASITLRDDLNHGCPFVLSGSPADPYLDVIAVHVSFSTLFQSEAFLFRQSGLIEDLAWYAF